MPVIVYKTLTLNVLHAQTRRIRCALCERPYTLVHGGTFTSQSTGLPLVSGDEGMRRAALKQALKRLRREARRPRRGVASCPHCDRPQPWMVRRVYLSTLLLWMLGLAIVGFLAGALWASLGAKKGGAYMLPRFLGPIAAGAVAGCAIGLRWARRGFAKPGEKDARAMTDEEFLEYVRTCEAGDADHALTWHFRLAKTGPPEKTLLVSLGFLDEAGGLDVPAGITTEHILREMENQP